MQDSSIPTPSRASCLAIRLAAAQDAGEADFLRLAGAAAKFAVCKRTSTVVAEALEVLCGNGYVEESVLPRLYRQAPLNSIWEGSGNVNALDVLRALGNSVILVIGAVAIVVAVGAPASYALSRVRFPGRDVFLYLLLLLSSVITGAAAILPLSG